MPGRSATSHFILLAEDNEINRDFLQEQLHLLGHTADVAVDGAQALQMWADKPYALLLTGCHVPTMDGFELTSSIRQRETPGTHVPIIAVTGNAMQGHAQRCLESGMDDYLFKPLRLAELAAMMREWLTESAGAQPLAWDADALTRVVGGNIALQHKPLQRFLATFTEQLAELCTAALCGDAPAAGELAHKMNSSSRTIGAMALGELCQLLEIAGRAGDAPACAALVAYVSVAFAATEHQINSILSPTASFVAGINC